MSNLDGERLATLARREAEVFASRTVASRRLRERARTLMPDGVPMSWMAGLYPHGPVFVRGGEGCHFEDVDGNRYLDMNQADLSVTCGFTPAPVLRAVQQQMTRGASFLLPGEDAITVCELLGLRFGLPCWQFTLSASGANAEALRVARLATGRERVLMFDGRYHGHGDEFLGGGGSGADVAEYVGLPGDAGARTASVPFNDLEALETALASGGFACLMAEPALTNCGLVAPDDGFWPAARALCERFGTLLVLDETHTQTFAYGGLTRALNLDPDLVSLGKCLGGGIPIGAYGMRAGLAGHMQGALDHHRGGAVLPVGGTLYANALSMAAARAVLESVLTEDAYTRLDRLGQRLASGLEAIFARHGLPWCAPRLGGRSGWCLRPAAPRNPVEASSSLDYELLDARWTWLANRGVWDAIASAGPACSFAHTETDVDFYLEAAAGFVQAIAG